MEMTRDELIIQLKQLEEAWESKQRIERIQYLPDWQNEPAGLPDEKDYFAACNEQHKKKASELYKSEKKIQKQISSILGEKAKIQKDRVSDEKQLDQEHKEKIKQIIIRNAIILCALYLLLLFIPNRFIWLSGILCILALVLVILHYCRIFSVFSLGTGKTNNETATKRDAIQDKEKQLILKKDQELNSLESQLEEQKSLRDKNLEAEEARFASEIKSLKKEYASLQKDYQKKLSEWEAKEEERKHEFECSRQRALAPWNEKYNELRPILPESFDMDNLSRLIDIFENWRADTIKEALNVMKNDIANEEQLEALYEANAEKERHNREMERHNRELERHNQEMEKKQTEMKRDQERHNREMERSQAQMQRAQDEMIKKENARLRQIEANKNGRCSFCSHKSTCGHIGEPVRGCDR